MMMNGKAVLGGGCRWWRAGGACLALAVASGAMAQAPAVPLQPALRVAHASQAGMLAAAWAGDRAVAVGEHGVVLLSDDAGGTWRQAKQVPYDGLLTSVSFVDRARGWAVGHAGVVLATEDGGVTWALQRSDTAADRPLYAVHFFDAQHGVAVGLWSLVLVTEDGGKTWQEQQLVPPEGARKADLNLLGLFANERGELFAAAEKGMVLRSSDRGHHWQYLPTGYAGSFWCGTALPDGALLVAGLRGSLYRSEDDGRTWQRVASGTKTSITALAAGGDEVLAVGGDGLVLRSTDGGRTFAARSMDQRATLTALLARKGAATLMFSRSGPVAPLR